MCFVSYVPIEGGYIFSSNRDEAPQRNAKSVKSIELNDKQVYFPADTLGGSWIFVSDQGDIICLLNGAFKNHQRKSNYKMSRGLMLKEYFSYQNPIDFFSAFDFRDIEPFTTIIVTSDYFFDFVWDGTTQYIRELDKSKAYNWSSSTLYSASVQSERSSWFYDALNALDKVDVDSVKRIHQIQKKGREHDSLIMNRNNIVKTISITQITTIQGDLFLSHSDLLSNRKISKPI